MKYNTNPSDVQHGRENSQADFLAELAENQAYLVLCKADKSPVDGWRKASAGAAIEHVATGGLVGVFPASLGLVCIDIDEGGSAGLNAVRACVQGLFTTEAVARTRRGWHIWRHADELPFTKRKFRYGAASGEIIYRGGYVCLHGDEAAQICRLLDSERAPVDRHLLERLPAEIGQKVTLTVFNRKRRPAVQHKGGWYVGNRSNQLNAEVWYATLFNRSLDIIIATARDAGLEEEKIARDVASTVKQAKRHEARIAAEIDQSDVLTVFKRKDARASCRSLLVAMACVAGEDGICYASQANLASASGLGLATVQRTVPRLIDAGQIEFVGKRDVGRRGKFVKHVNEYRIVV